MAKTGQGLADYGKSRVGTPYFYGAKISQGVMTNSRMNALHKAYPKIVTRAYMKKAKEKGQVGVINVDCSGLIAGYRDKNLGSAQLYEKAYARLPISEYNSFATGVVLWRSGHVGILSWENEKPYVYEAKNLDRGTVRSLFVKSNWKYGLTFQDISYVYQNELGNVATWKGTNPYPMPAQNIKYQFIYRNKVREEVKWLQWELVEAGYDIKIDGMFGPKTLKAMQSFQSSCKIAVDKICGKITKSKLTT